MTKKVSNMLICTFILIISILTFPIIVSADESKPIQLQPYAELVADKDAVHSMKFSPDGNLLAEGGEGQITLWNVKTMENISKVKLSAYSTIKKVIFTPDSSKLFAMDSEKIWLIDVKSSKIIYTINVHKNDYGRDTLDMVLSNDGKILYSVDCHEESSRLVFYCAENGNEIKKIPLNSKPQSLDYSKDNNIIGICLESGIIIIKDGSTGEHIKNIFIKNIDSDYNTSKPNCYTIEFSNKNNKLFCFKQDDACEYNKKIFELDIVNDYKNTTVDTNEFDMRGAYRHKISYDDQLIFINDRIYDLDSIKLIAKLPDYALNEYNADFSKDGNIFVLRGCFYDLSSIPRKKLIKIKINTDKTILNYNEKTNISLMGYYDNGTSEEIQYNDANWNTSDSSIASVNNGAIITKSSGKTTISVDYKGLKDNLDITVLPNNNNNNDNEYKVWETKYDQPVDKTFEVVFTNKMDISTIKEQNLYITDSDANIVPMFYYCNQGSENKVSIIPIKDYLSKQKYTLWIKNIKSIDGKVLNKNVKMNFVIK